MPHNSPWALPPFIFFLNFGFHSCDLSCKKLRSFYSAFLSVIRDSWGVLSRYFLMFLESQGWQALRGKLERTVMESGKTESDNKLRGAS